MKKWFFLTFITVLSSNSLVFSMQEPTIIEIENDNREIVCLNIQQSAREDLGSFQEIPVELTAQILTTQCPKNDWNNIRLVCKEFNRIFSYKRAQELKKLLNGEIIINPFGWSGAFQFNRLEDNRIDRNNNASLTRSSDFFLQAIDDAITQNTIQFQLVATRGDVTSTIEEKIVSITTYRGVVPSFELAYPPKDQLDPYTQTVVTAYGPSGNFTCLAVASFTQL